MQKTAARPLPSLSVRIDLDAEGRIWMADTTEIRYCFNSRGQGGRLVKPTKAWTPPEPLVM